MGDRVSLWLTYQTEDEPKFAAALGEQFYDFVEDEREAWKTVLIEEANWGLCHERHELAGTGLVFLGHHGANADYPEAVFAAFGGRQADVPALEGRPVVMLTAESDPEIAMLGQARRYLELERKARKQIGLESPD